MFGRFFDPSFSIAVFVTLLLLAYLPTPHAHPLFHTRDTNSHPSLGYRIRNSLTHIPLDALITNRLRNKTLQTSQRQATSTGLTLDPCTETQDCRSSPSGDRICVEIDDPESINCPASATDCQCAPTFDPACDIDSDECQDGEICAVRIADGFTFCVSQIYVNQNPDEFRRNETVSGGVTLDPCQFPRDCRDDLICAEDESNSTTCPQGAECFCFPNGPPSRCAVEWECPLGETCAFLTPEGSNVTAADLVNDTSLQGVCLSSQVVSESENFLDIFEVYNITIDPLGVADETERSGLRYELCERDSDCNSGSTCIADRLSQSTNCGPRGCRCFPDFDVVCVERGACEEGEECAALNRDFGIGICISREVLNSVIPALEPLREQGSNPLLPNGLTGDRCLFNSDCQDPRMCELDVEVPTACQMWDACFCFLPVTVSIQCETNEDCVPGERCVNGIGLSAVCVSETAIEDNPAFSEVSTSPSPGANPPIVATPTSTSSPSAGTGHLLITSPSPEISPSPVTSLAPQTSPSPTASPSPIPSIVDDGEGLQSVEMTRSPPANAEEAVCVDARMIAGLTQEELVFEENRWAKVLCDKWGSCATRGHIVVWEGRAMMMGSYCSAVVEGCEEQEMWVNSPRWRKGLRVAGRGGGLELTTFAARWATRWEEFVLRAAVHAGL